MGTVVWGVSRLCAATLGVSDKMSQLLQVGGSIAVGVLLFAGLAWLMKMEEIHIVLDIFGRRLRRRRLKQKTAAAGETAEEIKAEEPSANAGETAEEQAEETVEQPTEQTEAPAEPHSPEEKE